MYIMENKYCTRCQKVLQVVGNSRKNGKKHDDWESRKMHKKCWLIDKKIRLFDIYLRVNEGFKPLGV